jgi:ankyrin repeat protein
VGNLYARKAFMERGVTLHNTNKYVDHPQQLAALHDKLEVVYYLTLFGADTNILSYKNITALHLVSASGSVDSIKLLLDKVKSLILTDTDDSKPLNVSARCGNLGTKSVLFKDVLL